MAVYVVILSCKYEGISALVGAWTDEIDALRAFAVEAARPRLNDGVYLGLCRGRGFEVVQSAPPMDRETWEQVCRQCEEE